MEKTNIAIVGAGVCGLALSSHLSCRHRDIVVLERHDSFGRETSSRNSEVIHAGLYYPRNSLKAKLCREGNQLLYEFCRTHRIPHQKTGKILLSCNTEESQQLLAIQRNAADNGVALRFLSQEELHRLEPDILAQEALWSEQTGILDSHQLMKTLFDQAKHQGVDFAFNVTVTEISYQGTHYQITVTEPRGDRFTFQASVVINAAGLHADQVAAMAGFDVHRAGYVHHYNKGQYFRIRNPEKFTITHPVYPPASKTDLGIHITPDLAHGLRLGPDARYVKTIDYQVEESDKTIFFESVKRFLPKLSLSDLVADTAGIRAKLQAPGADFHDFVIQEESNNGFPGFINLMGIESPGLTSALAIARHVATWL